MSAPPAGRLVLCMSMSLDGFVARPDGVIDWFEKPGDPGVAGEDDRRHRGNLELLGRCDTILIGRVAYEDMVQA